MSADNLSKIQFKHHYYNGVHVGEHTLDAGKDGSYGHLSWDADTGKVNEVVVPEEHQRKGIATAMWNHAHKLAEEKGIKAPVHSEVRTPEGDAWAKKVTPDVAPAKKIVKDIYS